MKEVFSVPALIRWAFALLVSTNLGVSHAQEYEPYLEIEEKDSRFTIDAGDTSLKRILTALGDEVGFRVQDSGATRPKVTAFQVEDATLETTLRKLLATTNHLIVYSGDGKEKMEAGRIDTIILMGAAERKKSSGPVSASLAGPGGATQSPDEDRRAKRTRSPDPAETDDFPEEEFEREELTDEDLARELAENPEIFAEFDNEAEQIEADSAVAAPGRPSAILAVEALERQTQ